ncbi:MAG: hypothetical protein HKN25_03765 [Pyrinomonadaceae bacterium]|nr:hypothetical protein [Pyrinomonadaceae bacterium]
MNSKDHLHDLYFYNDWANRRLIRALKAAQCEKAQKYLCHVLVTEKEYYERLFGKDSTGFDFWKELSIDELSDLAKENAEAYESLLAKFDDEGLGQSVRYYTSKGEAVENTFREILTHVLLHSMNHRGQALTVLREAGFTPPVLDYIIYKRGLQ